jgi:hypothetical protein
MSMTMGEGLVACLILLKVVDAKSGNGHCIIYLYSVRYACYGHRLGGRALS